VKVVGIRGAIVCPDNTPQAISGAVTRLVRTLLSENALEQSWIISMFFTMTADLNAAFPAAAARQICGLDVPLLCASEVPVPGSLQRVIRVLVHTYYPPERGGVSHMYLDGAEILRPDIAHAGGRQ
jgi:chorismate mutase